ncbi:MAG: glycosyltransferase, partial [Bryobacteraceae bacterium]
MALQIVLDVRRSDDFGIGTYIRNLIQALGNLDQENQYRLITTPQPAHELPHLPSNFQTVTYGRSDLDPLDHVAFPYFLRQFPANLYHIPLNRVPLFMPKPYVVTIHDMSSLLFDENPGVQKGLRTTLRQYRFQNGLSRASRVIAVSASTKRDVENLMGVPPERIRLVYSAPGPEF